MEKPQMTYLVKELETVRQLKTDMLRRRRRRVILDAMTKADPIDALVQLLPPNTISLDWSAS